MKIIVQPQGPVIKLSNNISAELFAYAVILLFCRLLIFFNINFSKNSFRITIRVSNSLDQDQALRL